MSRKNTFSRALRHLNQINEQIPTNNTQGLYTIGDPSEWVPPEDNTYTELDFDKDNDIDEGKNTDGLFLSDGTILTVEPPGDTSYVLGPMSSMWYAWGNFTRIGYIRQSDRKMVNLGSITGQLGSWDEETFTSYGQLTLEQAVWFKNIQKKDGGSNDDPNYRAFYPGPPSNTPDEFGRYLCVITGKPKEFGDKIPGYTTKPEQGPGDASDNYSAQQGLFGLSKDQWGTIVFALQVGLDVAAIVGILFPEPGSSAAGVARIASRLKGFRTLQKWFNRGRNVRIKDENSASLRQLKVDDAAQQGKFIKDASKGKDPSKLTDADFEGGALPRNMGQLKDFLQGKGGATWSFNPGPSGGLRTGPTGFSRQIVNRIFSPPSVPKSAILGHQQQPTQAQINAKAADVKIMMDWLEKVEAQDKAGKKSNVKKSFSATTSSTKSVNNKADVFADQVIAKSILENDPKQIEDMEGEIEEYKDTQIAVKGSGGSPYQEYEDPNKGKKFVPPPKDFKRPGSPPIKKADRSDTQVAWEPGDPWPSKGGPLDGPQGPDPNRPWVPEAPKAKRKSKKTTMVAHHEPKGRVITESAFTQRKRKILREVKKPYNMPEVPTKFKVKPKVRVVGDGLMKNKSVPPQFKSTSDNRMWRKSEYSENIRASQEKKNQVLELIGEGDHQWNYMLNNERWRTSQQMEKLYGNHDYLYDYYYGGKNHKVLRKENLEKDFLLFLEDEDGVKSNILQSELNDLLAYEKDNEDFKDHYLYETEQNEREKNFDRVNKIKKVVSQSTKKRDIAPEYPKDPPPEMINGWHPKLADGKDIANRYNKLDPQSAEAMPKTGNPHIDAKVEKAKNKPK